MAERQAGGAPSSLGALRRARLRAAPSLRHVLSPLYVTHNVDSGRIRGGRSKAINSGASASAFGSYRNTVQKITLFCGPRAKTALLHWKFESVKDERTS